MFLLFAGRMLGALQLLLSYNRVVAAMEVTLGQDILTVSKYYT